MASILRVSLAIALVVVLLAFWGRSRVLGATWCGSDNRPRVWVSPNLPPDAAGQVLAHEQSHANDLGTQCWGSWVLHLLPPLRARGELRAHCAEVPVLVRQGSSVEDAISEISQSLDQYWYLRPWFPGAPCRDPRFGGGPGDR